VGVPYTDRGWRLGEVIDAMRTLWAVGPSTFKGCYQSFHRVHCDPKPVLKRIAKPEEMAAAVLFLASPAQAENRAAERIRDGVRLVTATDPVGQGTGADPPW